MSSSREASLTLKFKTDEAVKGMKDVERAGAGVVQQERAIRTEVERTNRAYQDRGDAASAASRTLDRYGGAELSRTEMRRQRAMERRIEREHDDAMKRVEEYRLNKHYERLRADRQAALDKPGFAETATAAWMRVGAYTALAHQAAQTSTGILRLNANSDLSNAQKVTGTAEAIPIFGHAARAAREFAEALTGVSEIVRRARLVMEAQGERSAAHWQNQGQQIQGAIAAADAAVDAASYVGMRAPRVGQRALEGFSAIRASRITQYDRSTVAGELGFREELQRLPGIDAQMEAQRQARVARGQLGVARNAAGIVETAFEQARHAQERAKANYQGIVNEENRTGLRRQGARDVALVEMNAANLDFTQLAEQRIAAGDRVRDAAVRASQAEARSREANINLMRTELQISENRTERLIGAAERFGSMNPLMQQLTASALRAMRDRGIEAMTPEAIGLASQLNPDYVRMQQRARAERSGDFQQLRREGLIAEGTRGSIADNQRETEDWRQRVREQTLESARVQAEQNAEILGSAFERLVRSLVARMEALEARIFINQQSRFNAEQ
jgi:hypothetical protein